MINRQTKELHDKLSEADDELKGVRDSLLEDVDSCYDLITHQDKQYWRRAYVRAVFAFIEGSVFLVKQVVFRHAEFETINLSSAERAFLLEETYQLNEQGDVSTKSHYGIRISQNIRFVWKLVTRMFSSEEVLDVGGAHWSSFQEAIKVRNRIRSSLINSTSAES